jgi:hypothetical protein
MQFELKTLSPEAVSRAIAKAERYRLLNEPAEAESICLDALEIEPGNHDALITLLLALTEQFEADVPGAVSIPTSVPTTPASCGSVVPRLNCIAAGWGSGRRSTLRCGKP